MPIKMILTDVDGVLSPPTMLYGADGEDLKPFHVRDGHRIKMALAAGIKVGVVSGRGSAALERRCGDLGLDPVCMRVVDKVAEVQGLLGRHALAWGDVAFIGDDLPDLPLLGKVGLFFTVADGDHRLRSRADHVLRAQGGAGALAEAVEFILRRDHHWCPQ